jgi:quercetin dioxygenase-like cupin family protein
VPADMQTAKARYKVKNIEPVVIGTDVQARIFTLAPGEVIPWHSHSESTDYYFVLNGTLTIEKRAPHERKKLAVGGRFEIHPRIAHTLSNRGAEDCQFLLLQGVGRYDWIKADG